MGDQLVARPLSRQDNTYTKEKQPDIHASTGIQNRGLSVSAAEQISCLRQRGIRKILIVIEPMAVAARSKARNVFGRSKLGPWV
jgi:hypothetical protein